MNRRTPVRTFSSIVAYSILAITFLGVALWLYAPKPLYPFMFDSKRFLCYTFFVIGALYAIALLNAVLRKLHELKPLPGILGSFYNKDFMGVFLNLFAWTRRKAESLKAALLLWCILIFVLTFLASSIGVLDDKELGLYRFFVIPHGLMGYSISNTWEPVNRDAPILQIALFLGDNNTEKYLKACLKIVSDLKRLGAKAVLVDVRSLIGGLQNIKLFQELNNTGIVVFGFRPHNPYVIGDVRDGDIKFCKGSYTMQDIGDGRPSTLPRFYPVIEGESFKFERYFERDVSLALLGKYHGYPDTLLPVNDDGTLVFGEYRIPVMSDGSLYVFRKDASNVSTIRANYGVNSDTLEFHTMFGKKLTLDSYENEIREKMVFMGWTFPGGVTGSSFFMPWYYTKAILNLMENKFVRKIEFIHLVISALLLFISALICTHVRPFLAMQLLFGVCVASFLGAYWLFFAYGILVNILYPCLTVLLAMVVLPFVKAAHEARLIKREA